MYSYLHTLSLHVALLISAVRSRIGDQIRAQNTRAEAAGVAARLSDARFRSGVDSFLVTLDAQRTAYGAEQALVTTRLTQASNLVELYRSLGGGLADEPLHGEARNGEIDKKIGRASWRERGVTEGEI